jgi:hypothetical protein
VSLVLACQVQKAFGNGRQPFGRRNNLTARWEEEKRAGDLAVEYLSRDLAG